MGIKIAVFLGSELDNDYRVLKTVRTLSILAEIDIFCVQSTIPSVKNLPGKVRIVATDLPDTFIRKLKKHSFFCYEFNSLANIAGEQKVNYDYIWANDLPVLYPASKLAEQLNAKLIYDSHEIYLETLNQFFPQKPAMWKKPLFRILLKIMRVHGQSIEFKLIKKADTFITVNNSLLDYFKAKYGVKNGHVIMNYPSLGNSPKKTVDLRKSSGWTPGDIVTLYQGNLNAGRGLFFLLDAMRSVKNEIKLLIIGDGTLRSDLHQFVRNHDLEDRVSFIDTLPLDILPEYTAGADIGINLLEAINLSKQMASPNKLFEYIQAGIPVLASDTIENRKLTDQYAIGILCETNPKDITAKLNALTHEMLENLSVAVTSISNSFTWENQENVILNVFRKSGNPETL